MNKKLFFSGLAAVSIATGAMVNVSVGAKSTPSRLSNMELRNSEALAGEAGENGNPFVADFKTGSITVNGITVPCCVPSVPSDACDANALGCIKLI
jgi:hypothetical protein